MEILRQLSQIGDFKEKIEIIANDVINIFYYNFCPFNIDK